jgi:hypothetical protein
METSLFFKYYKESSPDLIKGIFLYRGKHPERPFHIFPPSVRRRSDYSVPLQIKKVPRHTYKEGNKNSISDRLCFVPKIMSLQMECEMKPISQTLNPSGARGAGAKLIQICLALRRCRSSLCGRKNNFLPSREKLPNFIREVILAPPLSLFLPSLYYMYVCINTFLSIGFFFDRKTLDTQNYIRECKFSLILKYWKIVSFLQKTLIRSILIRNALAGVVDTLLSLSVNQNVRQKWRQRY